MQSDDGGREPFEVFAQGVLTLGVMVDAGRRVRLRRRNARTASRGRRAVCVSWAKDIDRRGRET